MNPDMWKVMKTMAAADAIGLACVVAVAWCVIRLVRR